MSSPQEETSLEAKGEPVTHGLACATGFSIVAADVRRALLGDDVLSDREVRWM